MYEIREKITLALAVIRNGGVCTFCSSALPQAAKASAMAATASAEHSTSAAATSTAAAPAAGSIGEVAESLQAKAVLEGMLRFTPVHVSLGTAVECEVASTFFVPYVY